MSRSFSDGPPGFQVGVTLQSGRAAAGPAPGPCCFRDSGIAGKGGNVMCYTSRYLGEGVSPHVFNTSSEKCPYIYYPFRVHDTYS